MQTLKDISVIQIGFTARGRLERMEGGIPVIQLRDTSPEGGLSGEPPARVRLKDVPERYWVKSGDVIFRSRGDQNTATALSSKFHESAVAVMPLVIMRANEIILPEYLAWYMNEQAAQRHFDRGARGTGIRMIPMDCLSSLKVPVPPIDEQRAIATVAGFAQREFELTAKLAEKRRQVVSASLLKAAHETTHNQSGTKAIRASRPAKEGTS